MIDPTCQHCGSVIEGDEFNRIESEGESLRNELDRLRKIEAAAKELFEADETHPFDSYFLPVESMRALRDALKGNNP